MTELFYPEYSSSILSLTASLLQGMGCPAGHRPLELLPPEEVASYRHVVLMVMDGLGWDFLQRGLDSMDMPPEAEIHRISSVYPPTTGAAMTTLYTGMSPAEHSYLGWTLWTGGEDPFINILPGNLLSKGPADPEILANIYRKLPLRSLFTQISQEGDGRKCFLVNPRSFAGHPYHELTSADGQFIPYQRDRDFARAIYSPVKKHLDQKTFTFTYNESPDKKIHLSGISSGWSKDFYRHFGHLLCKLASRYRGSDTLFLVTADHGLTDMEHYLALNESPDFMDLLERPPFPESRFLSFFVKPGKHHEFRQRFQELAGDHFMLLSRDEFMEKGFLGPGSPSDMLQVMLGDFLALATGRWGLKYYGSDKSRKKKPGCYKAHHAGLLPEEMQVPLIKCSFR